MRSFQKLKTIEDYKILDAPQKAYISQPNIPSDDSIMILRMLVRPKYGEFKIPESLHFLASQIFQAAFLDSAVTGIKDSWCYVTVRHGVVSSVTDDEWHFDGTSFRTEDLPDRNYIWVSGHPTEYKVGTLDIPKDFDPLKHNLFRFAAHNLRSTFIHKTNPKTWYLLSPFCLHRRPRLREGTKRTFIRISFTETEIRDIHNTINPLLPTPFYGRDPVKTFRNKLKDYYDTGNNK